MIRSSKKLPGWLDVLIRTYRNVRDDNIGLIAAGVAFYFFLAIFPALAVMISLFGLFSDPFLITNQMSSVSAFLPDDVVTILLDQAIKIASGDPGTLGLGLLISSALTLFAASKGVKALIMGLNVAFGVRETRNIVKQNILAIALTFFVLAVAIFALSFVAVLPALFKLLHLQYISGPLLLVRWPLLFFSGLVMLDVVYCYAPARSGACWRWLSGGALLAAGLWVGSSVLFSWYVSNFGNYNETYGALGAVIVLLIWLWISAGTVLLGAEFNAAVEQQQLPDEGNKPVSAGKTIGKAT